MGLGLGIDVFILKPVSKQVIRPAELVLCMMAYKSDSYLTGNPKYNVRKIAHIIRPFLSIRPVLLQTVLSPSPLPSPPPSFHSSLTKLATNFTGLGLVLPGLELLPKNGEVGLVSSQPQHNQVSISTIKAVVGIWIVVRVAALAANVVHNLVLTLTRDIGI